MREYDLAQADKLSIGLITEAVITLYLDLIAKMSYMLLIIPLSGITGKINNPLVQVHFFKKKAMGALARPFKSAFEPILGSTFRLVLNSPNPLINGPVATLVFVKDYGPNFARINETIYHRMK